ncbi:hypothetical protein PQX77_016904 [Marasmius sp. AFHP31]|nr:hypothetical protein PQX77_016904 [Marasmius sp. AFHP31]
MGGGCVYPNPWDTATSGRNCATPHALKAACRQSQCVVDLCQDGFAPNDARDACVAIHRKRLTPASHELLRLRTLDYPEFDALPSDLNVRRSSLCPPPSPTIPASPPTTQNGLLDLIVDLHTLGKKIDSLGGTLSDKCNCHDSPSHPSPHNPAPMLKSVVTLSLKVDAKLGDLSNNPANIDSVVVLLGQLLNASDKCLALPGLVGELENIIVQLKDVVGRLLKGLQLLSSGVKQCGCKAGLISSLKGGLALKRGFAFRRGVACTDIHKRDIVDSRGLVDGLVKGLGLGDILSPVDNPAGSVSTVSTTTTGPSEGSSCGPCIGPDGQPDPTAPVDVDLTCLLGLGLDADVIADLGPGLNMPLNEVSNSLLGNGVHPSNVIHPCLKCSGGNGGGGSGSGSGSATGTGSEATMTTSDCTSSPSSPARHPTPTGTSVGIPPPSQPTGSTGGNSGSGASSNTAIPTSSAPTPHSSVVVTTRSSAPSSSPTVGTGTGGSSGSGSGNSDPTGPCVDSNGQPDPTAPVDVDLTCLLGIPGIDVDVALNLESLNVPLNQLHKLVGDGVHPSNVIHPCLKCTGGGGSGSESGSGSGPSTTSPTGSSSTSGCSEDGPPATATPVTPPNTNGPKSGDGKCGQGSGDSTNAVVVDLTPIGIDAVATVDLGCSINKLLNDLLDPLDPIVHAAPSRRSGSGSPSVEGVKAALNATVNFGSAISGTAETLYGSCGCKGEPHSPILLTVAVSATLKKSIDDLQKNPTVETATAALNAAKALLETAQSCEALPGLKAQAIALIHSLEKDCQGLIPQLEYLVSGLQTCGCGKELKL